MHRHGVRYAQDQSLMKIYRLLFQVRLMFGRTVDKAMTGNGISKMYKGFLEQTSISSNKKAHLARRTVPTLLEDMGYVSMPTIGAF